MPVLDRPLVIYTTLAYLVVVLAVGLWTARRTRSARDFFIAGQGIGLFVTGLATMSAAFSGFIFLGGPGLTYRVGLGSLLIVLPVGFTAGLLCWVVGEPLRLRRPLAVALDGAVDLGDHVVDLLQVLDPGVDVEEPGIAVDLHAGGDELDRLLLEHQLLVDVAGLAAEKCLCA